MPVIDFHKQTIGKILIDKKNLRVPVNQRSYAWKAEHVRDLYRDLGGAISKGDQEYFLGSVIIVVPKGEDSIEVYDGQQRLATSMILIAAIRDFFYYAADKDTANNISLESLFSPTRKTNDPRPHFTLSGEDNEFFTNRILRQPDQPQRTSAKPDPQKESHARIEEAAQIAAEYVSTITKHLSPADSADLLHRWLDFLEKGSRVIWVEVEDQPTAYRIFETMNDRGLKLSAADLIKNYLYSLAGKRQGEIIQKWQSMVAVLESLGKDDGDLVDYIRYFWITTHGQTRSSELFDQLKKEVNSEHTAASWVGKLEARADDYAALLTSSHQAWNGYHQEVRATVETLRFLGVSQVRPLLFAAYAVFGRGEMERLLKLAVNWSVRCLLSGVPSGTLENHYSKNAKKLTDGSIKNLKELAKEMAEIIPSDERFTAAVKTASVQTASLARYYLRRIQMEVDGDVEPQYVPNDGKPVTLEHVLPQKPGKGWGHISPEDAKANYNRLGNQALLAGSVNSQLNNVEFRIKRPALGASAFSLTADIAKNTNWDISHIAARQAMMAPYAVKAWPLSIK